MNKSMVHQAHKDVFTSKKKDFIPELKDTTEGEKQINEGVDPKTHEHNEKVPGDVTDTNQNQYREYLGASTAGKVSGDIFDEDTEITVNLITAFKNSIIPFSLIIQPKNRNIILCFFDSLTFLNPILDISGVSDQLYKMKIFFVIMVRSDCIFFTSNYSYI